MVGYLHAPAAIPQHVKTIKHVLLPKGMTFLPPLPHVSNLSSDTEEL